MFYNAVCPVLDLLEEDKISVLQHITGSNVRRKVQEISDIKL